MGSLLCLFSTCRFGSKVSVKCFGFCGINGRKVFLKVSFFRGQKSQAACNTALEKEFDHSVPNSMLHQMTNLHVLLKFYKSPISSNTPYEQLYLDSQDGSLPPNL